jgi:hypothetical protein
MRRAPATCRKEQKELSVRNLARWSMSLSGLAKADLTTTKLDFRFAPQSGLKLDIAPCPKGAIRRHRSFLCGGVAISID